LADNAKQFVLLQICAGVWVVTARTVVVDACK